MASASEVQDEGHGRPLDNDGSDGTDTTRHNRLEQMNKRKKSREGNAEAVLRSNLMEFIRGEATV